VGRLGNWLGTLDPDETGRILRAGDALDEAPAFTLEARDWVIGFRALPKKAEARGKSGRPLGAFPGKISAVDDRTPILSALRSKATRYGELDRPYVVALLVDRVFADEEDVEEALFGPVHYTLVEGAEDLSAKPLRHPDGLWQRGSANRNTRVSAVLAAINLAPYFVARNMPRLWHNPWARRPLTAELPWPGAAADPETGLLERGEANVPPHELFGLQAEWPGPEDPFPRGET